MSGITKTLFGGSDSKQEQRSSSATSFGVRRTPYSNFTGDTLTLDPTIRSLQEETLSGFRGLIPGVTSVFDSFKTNMGAARDSLIGNSGLLRQARLNPIQQAIARRRGELYQSTGERGLAGSSFQNQALDNFELDSAKAIGEASALADADTLSATTGIDKDVLNAMIGKVEIMSRLFGLPADIAQKRLEEEINAFTFGKGNTSNYYGSGSSDAQTGIFTSLSRFARPRA